MIKMAKGRPKMLKEGGYVKIYVDLVEWREFTAKYPGLVSRLIREFIRKDLAED